MLLKDFRKVYVFIFGGLGILNLALSTAMFIMLFSTLKNTTLVAKIIWSIAALIPLEAGASLIVVATCYNFDHANSILAKQQDGRFNPISYLLFWQFHIVVFLLSYLIPTVRNDEPCTEIVPGLYVGSWRSSYKFRTKPRQSPASSAGYPTSHQHEEGWFAITDMTCELPRRNFKALNYKNFATWDGCAPTLQTLTRAVDFVHEMYSQLREENQQQADESQVQLNEEESEVDLEAASMQQAVMEEGRGSSRVPRLVSKKILIHCAHGRARSVTCLTASLVSLGFFSTWQDAYEFVRTKRPCAHLCHTQKQVLDAWQQLRQERLTQS